MMIVFPVYQLCVLVVATTAMILVVLLWPKEREVSEDPGTQTLSSILEKTTDTPRERMEVRKRQQIVRQGWHARKKGEFLATELLENLKRLMKIMGT